MALLFMIGCYGLTMRFEDNGPQEFRGTPQEAKYSLVGDYYYVTVSALQGGWKGWRNRYLSRDGLFGVQLAVRFRRDAKKQIYSVPEECEGFVFLRSAMGPGAAWEAAEGTVSAEPSEQGLVMEAKIHLRESYPDRRSGSFQTDDQSEVLVLSRTILAMDREAVDDILSPRNLAVQPTLITWQEQIRKGSASSELRPVDASLGAEGVVRALE